MTRSRVSGSTSMYSSSIPIVYGGSELAIDLPRLVKIPSGQDIREDGGDQVSPVIHARRRVDEVLPDFDESVREVVAVRVTLDRESVAVPG